MTRVFDASRSGGAVGFRERRGAGLRVRECGFSLLSTLFLTGIVAAVFVSMATFSDEVDKVSRARASGKHLTEVARAARLYVRNNSVIPAQDSLGAPLLGDFNGDGIDDATFADAAVFGDGAGGIFAQEITVPMLVAAGLLPQGFRDINSLKQTVRILVANHPLRGDPADPATVPSAYIVLQDSRDSTPALMHHVAEAAKEEGFSVGAPTFNSAGTPIDDCDADSQPDAVLWDSGCISQADANSLLSSVGIALPFQYMGALVVPAWPSMPHDTRAVMRYRQAENPDAARLMTNVAFGPEIVDASGVCTSEMLALMSQTAGGYSLLPTGLCNVLPDDPAGATQREQDIRVDVLNLANLDARRLVLADQGIGGATEISYSGTVRNVDGDVAANGLRSPAAVVGLEETLGVTGNLSVNGALHVVQAGVLPGGVPAVAFFDGTGAAPGEVVVESSVIISDGNPATDENLIVATPVVFGDTAVPSASASSLRVAGQTLATQVNITGANTITADTITAGTALISNNLGTNTISAADSMNAVAFMTDNLEAARADVQSISGQSVSVNNLSTQTLSMGNTQLVSGGGPDISVDVIITTVCTGNVPTPAPPECN